jgi:hypothetical protein
MQLCAVMILNVLSSVAATTYTLGVTRNDTGGTVVATGTAMTFVAGTTYQYTYTVTEPVPGLTYTVSYSFTINRQVVAWPDQVSGTLNPASPGLACNYTSLVNEIGWHLFGLRPTGAADLITAGIANAAQAADILRAIQKGMQMVYYCGYAWSFLEFINTFNTLPAYNTGTVIVDASGNATLSGGTFPSYSASSYGQIWIGTPQPPAFNAGSWQVGTYNSGTSLTLANYTGPTQPQSVASGSSGTTNSAPGTTFTWGAPTTASIGQYVIVYAGSGATLGAYAITGVNGTTSVTLATSPGASLSGVTWSLSNSSGVPYNLTFNRYVLPTNCETANENLTMPSDGSHHEHSVQKVDELMIRQRLSRGGQPRRPEAYALTTSLYQPTSLPSTSRYITLFPPPDLTYTYAFKATLRPTMLDAVNQYPPGDGLAAGCLMEACLAAAERYVEDKINGPHSLAFPALLAAAIKGDKMQGAPESLGVDYGQGDGHHGGRMWRGGAIHLQVGGLDEWI